MQLKGFSYWEERAAGEEWEIDGLVFGQFNLVVGRNATGKTRLLKAISRAAAQDSGELKSLLGRARIHTVFSEGQNAARPKGKEPQEMERLRKEANARWGRRLQYFPFAGKMNLKVHAEDGTIARLGPAEAYRRGKERIGSGFAGRVGEWMEEIGYPIGQVAVRESKEGLAVVVEKHSLMIPLRRLSQGEQRTLVLMTFLALLEAEDKAITVLIDDFAEGLDFEHAARAARFLLRIVPETKLQLIVATNDRYVMNAVPLEYWTVLVEEGNETRVFHYANSKGKFDDFKFSGLNNFDFFSMDFASAGA